MFFHSTYDSIYSMIDKISPYKLVKIQLSSKNEEIVMNLPYCEIIKKEDDYVWYRFNKKEASIKQVMSEFISRYDLADIKVEDPDIEYVIKEIYLKSNKG